MSSSSTISASSSRTTRAPPFSTPRASNMTSTTRKAFSLPPAEQLASPSRTRPNHVPGHYINRRASSASIFPVLLPRSSSVESIPEFTTPDYTQPSAHPLRFHAFSPLTLPTIKRPMSMPAHARMLSAATLAKIGLLREANERKPRDSSSASDPSGCFPSTSIVRHRASSVTTIGSTADKGLTSDAAPPDPVKLMASGVVYILLLTPVPTLTQNSNPTLRPYEREIILSEEQERNPPTLPKRPSPLTRAYIRARAAFGKLAPSSQRVTPPPPAYIPYPVDSTTLVSVTGIPLVVSQPYGTPRLPKGPAPVVPPVRMFDGLRRRFRRGAALAALEEEGVVGPGW